MAKSNSSSDSKEIKEFLEILKKKNPNEAEFHQVVEEVVAAVIPFINRNKKYQGHKLLERIVEPERTVTFRVTWVDDDGNVQVNRGYRVEMNSAIGPYKGGLRFHPTVNLSIFKSLAFEQVLKNSLTTLPLGGGKGGSDFNPKGKSDNEVMRFCQSFMTELYRHIGTDTDVPAGDMGVGSREIGYMYGQYKRITNQFTGAMTGKDTCYGGSSMREEATGFGCIYFVQEMLERIDESLEGKTICISGAGNVALHACEKAISLGAKVVTLSDSDGYIYDSEGINEEKLDYIKELKIVQRGRLEEYTNKYKADYHADERPWGVKCDIALPCATQNELNEDDAQALIKNGVQLVAEGANMPCKPNAVDQFQKAGVLLAPGKAANAGGVATSGLEMTQNALGYSWTAEEVDEKLKSIIKEIHSACIKYGTGDDGEKVNYVKGANIAGFVKVADAMMAQGVV